MTPLAMVAVAVARRYLGYFQGRTERWSAPDQRRLRHVVPESRVRAYDVRRAIETLADDDSVLELRAGFAPGIVTALVRIEGRPMGLVANNPRHLGGAIDTGSLLTHTFGLSQWTEAVDAVRSHAGVKIAIDPRR